MEIKYGLISSDSHGQLGKDAYTSRMSRQQMGRSNAPCRRGARRKIRSPVERWVVNGEIQRGNVCNCPTAMGNRKYYPQRWEEVPLEVYDPVNRLKAWTETASMRKCFFPMAQEERFSTTMRNSSSPACELTMTLLPNFVR